MQLHGDAVCAGVGALALRDGSGVAVADGVASVAAAGSSAAGSAGTAVAVVAVARLPLAADAKLMGSGVLGLAAGIVVQLWYKEGI